MVLTDADNGKTIQAHRGDMLEVKLAANPTTGHRWALPVIQAQEGNRSSVAVISDKYLKDQPVLVGSGGIRVFAIQFAAAGVFVLKFDHRRSWEPVAARTFQITVVVN